MLQTFTLKNGVKVATFSIPQMRSVTLDLGVKGGSIFDTPQTSGVAHFMEHLLVQGIPSLPDVESFSNYIEGFAGSYNAITYPQTIRFWLNAPVSRMEDVLRIGSEVFFKPLFQESAIERERGAILEEIRGRQDNLGYKLNKFFREVRFKKGHPLLLDTGGDLKSVGKLKKADLLKYWSHFFVTHNSYLVLVGGFNNKDVKKEVKKFFGLAEMSGEFTGFGDISNKEFSNRKVAIRDDDKLQTCYLDLTYPSIPGSSSLQDRIVQSITMNILGALRTSRLYRLLRQKMGLVYTVSADHIMYDNFGYVYISTEVVLQKLDEVLDLIIKELDQFRQTGPTKDEVEFAKNYQINRNLMSWDHPGNIAEWIRSELMWEDKISTPEEYVELVKKVKSEDVVDFMQKNWDFEKLNLVIQGPISNSRENLDRFSDVVSIIT